MFELQGGSQDRIARQLCSVVADDRLGLAARGDQKVELAGFHTQSVLDRRRR